MIVAALTLLVFLITLAACVYDVRFLRIPNALVLVIFVAFIAAFAVAPQDFGRWWEHIGACVLVLLITYGMFAAGMLGGGDAKFGAALALWVGLPGLLPYMSYMALVGGLLGLAALVIKKTKPFKNPSAASWVGELQAGKSAVPYGIAITVGTWAALFHTGFLHHRIDEVINIIH